MCLVTIGVREGDHTGQNTFVLWLGPFIKTSTSSVEELLATELNSLRKGLDSTGKPFLVYHKPSERLVHVCVCLYAFLCDKIDKAKRTQMLQGGTYHLRHGYMGNFNRDINSIISCKECYETLTTIPTKDSPGSTLKGIHNCQNCKCFEIDRMDFEVESDYPTNFPKNCSKRFKPNEDSRLKFQNYYGWMAPWLKQYRLPLIDGFVKIEVPPPLKDSCKHMQSMLSTRG